jgi:hypothetical protein
MAATLYSLHVPLVLSHIVGLNYFTNLHVNNGFDRVLFVVGHRTRMAHFLPYKDNERNSIGNRQFVYMESTYYMECPECWSWTATQNSFAALSRRFGDDPERDSTRLLVDTQKRTD